MSREYVSDIYDMSGVKTRSAQELNFSQEPFSIRFKGGSNSGLKVTLNPSQERTNFKYGGDWVYLDTGHPYVNKILCTGLIAATSDSSTTYNRNYFQIKSAFSFSSDFNINDIADIEVCIETHPLTSGSSTSMIASMKTDLAQESWSSKSKTRNADWHGVNPLYQLMVGYRNLPLEVKSSAIPRGWRAYSIDCSSTASSSTTSYTCIGVCVTWTDGTQTFSSFEGNMTYMRMFNGYQSNWAQTALAKVSKPASGDKYWLNSDRSGGSTTCWYDLAEDFTHNWY